MVPMDPSTIVAAFTSKPDRRRRACGIPLVDVMKRRVPGLVELANDEEFYPGGLLHQHLRRPQ